MQTVSATHRAAPAETAEGWTNNFQNLAREHGFEPMRVEGTLPAELDGTFYRNGPGLFDCFGERYRHWFDGDGAVSAVRLRAGAATGAVRLIQTPGLKRERAAKKRLFGSFNTPLARPIREMFFGDGKNPANTSIVVLDGRPHALCEAGLPTEISPHDLSTLGETRLGGAIVGAFSAHPHDVRQRSARYNFGTRIGPKTQIDVYELPYGKQARRLTTFAVKGATFIHDFVVTERHLLFVIAPLRIRVLPMLLRRGGPMDCSEWRAQDGTELVIVPIDDPAAHVRIQVDSFYLEHTVNAFERGAEIVFDYVHYNDVFGLERYVGKLLEGRIAGPLESSIRRAVVDPKSKRVRFEERLARAVELPRVSPSVDARPHRFMYAVGSSRANERERFFDAILKHDPEAGKVETFSELGCFPSEAVFVPRTDARTEDDGWLLTMIYDARVHRSHLAVLDARDPANGPVARAWFDQAIPFGFHGVWAETRH